MRLIIQVQFFHKFFIIELGQFAFVESFGRRAEFAEFPFPFRIQIQIQIQIQIGIQTSESVGVGCGHEARLKLGRSSGTNPARWPSRRVRLMGAAVTFAKPEARSSALEAEALASFGRPLATSCKMDMDPSWALDLRASNRKTAKLPEARRAGFGGATLICRASEWPPGASCKRAACGSPKTRSTSRHKLKPQSEGRRPDELRANSGQFGPLEWRRLLLTRRDATRLGASIGHTRASPGRAPIGPQSAAATRSPRLEHRSTEASIAKAEEAS